MELKWMNLLGATHTLAPLGAFSAQILTQVVVYCNGGVASTAVLFALWRLGVPLSRRPP